MPKRVLGWNWRIQSLLRSFKNISLLINAARKENFSMTSCRSALMDPRNRYHAMNVFNIPRVISNFYDGDSDTRMIVKSIMIYKTKIPSSIHSLKY